MKNSNQDISGFLGICSEAMEKYRKLHMDAAKQLTRLQLDFMNLCMEYNSSQMQRLAKAETPSDVVATESGIATEYMSKFFNNTQQTFDAFSKTQEEMLSWMQNNNMLFQPGTDTETKSTKKTSSATQ